MMKAAPPPAQGRTRYQFLHRFLRAFASNTGDRFQILTGDGMNEEEKAALYGCRRTAITDLLPSWRLIEHSAISDGPLGPLDRMLEFDFHFLLGGDHLVKMDMASMAYGLEARSPFLDHELVEFAAHLPEDYKLDGKTTKPLLRALAEKLLPPDVARAPKRGFEIPLQRWMQQDLNTLLRETVLDSRSYAMTHFDPQATRALIGGTGRDAKRWSGIAWTMLCLEFWWKNYMHSVLPVAADARRSAGPLRIAV
jgi:asparagine synthase (glutamine-hydrolysing)